MENSSVPSKVTLEERLKEYPELKAKIETLLGIIENAGGDIEKAAEAERRIIEELGQMGNEALHGWARRQQEKKEQEYNAKPGGDRKSTRLNSSHGYISYAAFSLKKKNATFRPWGTLLPFVAWQRWRSLARRHRPALPVDQ